YVSRQWARRTETQQDQLGGSPAALAERFDRYCRREPVAAREQSESATAPAGRSLPAIARKVVAGYRHNRRRAEPPGFPAGAVRRRQVARGAEGSALLARGWHRAGCAGSGSRPGE